MQGFLLIVDPCAQLSEQERHVAIRRALPALKLSGAWEVCERTTELASSVLVGTDVSPCHEQRDGTWMIGDISGLRLFGRSATRSEVSQILSDDARAGATRGAAQLRGHGALALVDERAARVLLWRDRLGLRPLFYGTREDGVLVVSNSLDAVVSTGLLSRELDRESLIEFMLFTGVRDPHRTCYAQVRRLPAAHVILSGRKARQYWAPEPTVPVCVSGRGQVLRAFREGFSDALARRLAAEKHAVMMSGGLDSTSVAALTRAQRPAEALDVWTVLRASAPEEGAFARQAAQVIGARHHSIDEDQLFSSVDAQPQRWACAAPGAIGPWAAELRVADAAIAAGHDRVLTGQGGDMLLRPSFDRVAENLRHGQLRRLATELRDQALFGERRPPLFLRERLRERLSPRPRLPLPAWVRPELVKEYNLQERWDAQRAADRGGDRKLELASGTYWTNLMEMHDPWFLRRPLRFEACFVDDELHELVRGLPEWPWLVDKRVLREVMEDLLPESVRLRPKSTSEWANDQLERQKGAGSGAQAAMQTLEEEALASPLLAELVDVDRIQQMRQTPQKVAPWQYTLSSGVVALGWWIRYGSLREGGSHR